MRVSGFIIVAFISLFALLPNNAHAVSCGGYYVNPGSFTPIISACNSANPNEAACSVQTGTNPCVNQVVSDGWGTQTYNVAAPGGSCTGSEVCFAIFYDSYLDPIPDGCTDQGGYLQCAGEPPVDECDWPANGLDHSEVDFTQCPGGDPGDNPEDENNCSARGARGDTFTTFLGHNEPSYAVSCNAGCAVGTPTFDTSGPHFVVSTQSYTGSNCDGTSAESQDATDAEADSDNVSTNTTTIHEQTTTSTETNPDGSVTTSSTTTVVTNNYGGAGTGTQGTGTGDGEGSSGTPWDDLYEPTEETWTDVLTDFQTSIQNTAIYSSASGFFDVGTLSGSCPTYSTTIDVFGTITLDQWCGSAMNDIWPWIQAIFILVCGFFAFRIAILD